MYLTAILDLADRKVVGWSLSSSLKVSDTTVPAWNMAVSYRPITQSLIFHSDRGEKYACNEFRNLLSRYKLVERSMVAPCKSLRLGFKGELNINIKSLVSGYKSNKVNCLESSELIKL